MQNQGRIEGWGRGRARGGGGGGGRRGGVMHNYIIPLMVTTKQRYGDYADGGDGDDTP